MCIQPWITLNFLYEDSVLPVLAVNNAVSSHFTYAVHEQVGASVLTRNFPLRRTGNNDASQSRGGSGCHIHAADASSSRRSSPPQRAFKRHEHRGRAARIVSQGALHREGPAALSTGLIPAVQATPSLSLHLLSAGLRTRRWDRHARGETQKNRGSVCAPPALPRLVNILHAVGAGRVLRKGLPRCRRRDYLRVAQGMRREDEKAAPTPARIDRTSG